jgi:hypothetical protein
VFLLYQFLAPTELDKAPGTWRVPQAAGRAGFIDKVVTLGPPLREASNLAYCLSVTVPKFLAVLSVNSHLLSLVG